MAELTAQERLQPCLIDRLTDENPRSTAEGREQRVVSTSKLREAVVRDLSWLLNTNNYPWQDELEPYPEVRESVINYGLRDVRGTGATTSTLSELRRLISSAIERFEPRIVAGSLRVEPIEEEEAGRAPTQLAFEIDCEIWAQPVPDRLYLKTEVDLETGLCNVEKL